MRKILAATTAIMVALLLGCSSSDDESTSEQTTTSGNGQVGGSDDSNKPGVADKKETGGDAAALGNSFEVEYPGRGTSTVTVHTAEWKTEGGSPTAPAPTNGAYLLIDVEWSGLGSFNRLYLNFHSADGTVHEGVPASGSGYLPALGSGDLKGGTERGYIAYDVPKGPGKIVLTDPLDEPVGSWKIDG